MKFPPQHKGIDLNCYVGSDWAGDPDSRKSTSGASLFVSVLTHPKFLGWRFLKRLFLMILIRFRYDLLNLLLCFVYGLVLRLWFWYGFSYDFDMVSVMILDVGQTCDLKPTRRNHVQNIPKSYQNHIKIGVSKPYQNHIKTTKTFDKSTKNLSLGCFCFFKPTRWNHIKTVSKSYQNRIKIESKSNQNRIKIVSKPYQNHIEIITPNSKHIKFISSNRIQNHIKIVKKIFPEFSILEGFRSHKGASRTQQSVGLNFMLLVVVV